MAGVNEERRENEKGDQDKMKIRRLHEKKK